MAAATRKVYATYRWTIGLVMLLYCYMFSRLPLDVVNDQHRSRDAPVGIEQQLKVFGKPPPARRNVISNRNGLSNELNEGQQEFLASVFQQLPVRRSANRRKLQEKLDEIFLTTGQEYIGDLWELSDYIPDWMKGEGCWRCKSLSK